MTTTDPKLVRMYRDAMATGNQFKGLSILRFADSIGNILRDTYGDRVQSVRLLDYGCGLGDQYRAPHLLHKRWGCHMPKLYDPSNANHKIGTRPVGTFNAVICSDVLEHVPEHLIDSVLHDIFGYAEDFVWMSVCCRPAKKFFPDGRNMHLTVRCQDWWVGKILEAAKGQRHFVEWSP